MVIPGDSNSLLVPVHLHAWVVDSQSQQVLARYQPDYSLLESFEDPFPAPITTNTSKPDPGIYLHWALPDALTHTEVSKDGTTMAFAAAPNRWLVVRNSLNSQNGFDQKAWVIQSDFVHPITPGNSYPFPDPNKASTISNDGTSISVYGAAVGKKYTVQAWQAQGDPGTTNYFLKAVAPGNISFAAFQSYCDNVFSFTDKDDLPAEGTGAYQYSYMVVGWYSDPQYDPLNGITTASAFQTLLTNFKWSLPTGTTVPEAAPVSSLYHGFLADVQWPYGTVGERSLDVDIAVGNTAADALAALIQNYASIQSKSDPGDSQAWLNAGNTLCSLLQAAMLQLLDDYGTPGGSTLVEQQVEKSWFGKDPGGTIWKVAAVTAQAADFNVGADALTAAQNTALIDQLAALNTAQQQYDSQQRILQSLQRQLYMLWLDLAQSKNYGWGLAPTTVPDWSTILQPVLENDLYPDLYVQVWKLYNTQAAALTQLPNTVSMETATAWADKNWSFPATDGPGTVTLSDLKLSLKNTAATAFHHPVDPVVLICGAGRSLIHGEDGRYNPDGTLTVRLGGQTITGLQATGQPAINAAAISAAGVIVDTLAQYSTIPNISNLLTEAFFCDPLNAALMASAVPGATSDALKTCITALLNNDTSLGKWGGTAPSPVGYSVWIQAWSPLWMEWMVDYYPTQDTNMNFDMSSWNFDGTHYAWNGGGFPTSFNNLELSGRTVVSPYAQNMFSQAINSYLTDHKTIDNPQLDLLISTVMGWDILSQSLNGFTAQLVNLLPQTSFMPPVSGNSVPVVPLSPSPSVRPPVGDLVQDQYRYMPLLTTSLTNNWFFPVRGALVTFSGLQIVDTFGQIFQLNKPNTGNGFVPLISPSLKPPHGITTPGNINAPFLLGPRLAQSVRLNMDFLANDGSGSLSTSLNTNPICGWLLPNHLDNSIDVYDGDGLLLGELLQLPAPYNWRPRPGEPGDDPPPAQPSGITNTALKNVVMTLAAQPAAVFADFIKVVDETLWMSDPLGTDNDSFISNLIGRPLAVTQINLSLELNGNADTCQLWDAMLTPGSTTGNFTPVHDTASLEKINFPVRLGSLELRNDGLMGYFINADAVSDIFPAFYTVHNQPGLSAGDTFIQPVVTVNNKVQTYKGNLDISVNGYGEQPVPVTVTLISDPLGVVHGYTGIIPVTTASLPAYEVQQFVKKMLVNFQTGPLIADSDTMRTPLPAEKQGTWDWLQYLKSNWVQSPIVDVDDAARFPLQPPVIREGWLQLKGLENDD